MSVDGQHAEYDAKSTRGTLSYELAKRTFDVVSSSVALLILSPVLVIAGLVVLLGDGRPILYTPVRTGRNGKQFRIYKFRTMFVRSDAGQKTTALNDPRIYPGGSFLRKYKIDELPQLVNVLCGEMSIVGPRPELPFYTDRYSIEEQEILSVKPGITDLSSLRFRSLDKVVGKTDADAHFERDVLATKNQLRLQYVRERSFMNDVRIVIRTILTLFRP